MPSGGARSRSGPPPDPAALRRARDDGEWRQLPAAGRQGDAPDWPLRRASTFDRDGAHLYGFEEREAELWAEMWMMPQAIVWEENSQYHEVAVMVRTMTRAEHPDAAAALVTLLRQQQEALGLSIPGMLRNKWTIVPSPMSRAELSEVAAVADAKASLRARATGS